MRHAPVRVSHAEQPRYAGKRRKEGQEKEEKEEDERGERGGGAIDVEREEREAMWVSKRSTFSDDDQRGGGGGGGNRISCTAPLLTNAYLQPADELASRNSNGTRAQRYSHRLEDEDQGHSEPAFEDSFLLSLNNLLLHYTYLSSFSLCFFPFPATQFFLIDFT